MKTFFSSKWVRIAAGAILAVAVALSSLAFAPAPVYAQSSGPGAQKTPQAGEKGAKHNTALELAYTREQARLLIQNNHFVLASEAADRLEKFIAKAKENGQDVSALESALSTFNAQLPKAQAAHDQAKSILAAHTGFDANGKVTDPAAAKTTVDDGRKALNDAQVLLRQAGADLHAAVRAWREAHPPVKKTATPQ